jgi:cephalosporin hydroxylase
MSSGRPNIKAYYATLRNRLKGVQEPTTWVPPIRPPAVAFELSMPMARYWEDRARQHTLDNYCGVALAKFPEDLRTYEHILWSQAPNTVIELGTAFGASALWFRDRLRTLEACGRIRDPRVISVDLQIDEPQALIAAVDPEFDETIKLLAGDVRDPGLPEIVAALLPTNASCLVIEDTAHEYDTTLAALQGFARFVPLGGWFVVEDGYVDIDERRYLPELPRGVLPALDDWLHTNDGRCFEVRRDMEIYGLSSHPRGFLCRNRPSV